MCNKKIIWVVVLVMASLSSWASANIKGNGSVVTREIKVSDYSSIRLGGNVSSSLGESIKKLFSGEKNSGSSSVNNVFHIDKITFVWRHEASFGKLLQGFRNAHSQCKVLLLAVDQNFMSVAFQKVNI